MFSQVFVRGQVHGLGGLASQQPITGHMTGGLHPGGSASKGEWVCIQRGLPPEGDCLQGVESAHGILQDTVNKREVCILLESILVREYLSALPAGPLSVHFIPLY